MKNKILERESTSVDIARYTKKFHLCGWKIEQCNRLKIKILYTI